MMSLGLLNWNFILDYSHSSHSGHAPRDSKLYISSRWACRTGCWALGWDETQPASCEPERSYRGGKKQFNSVQTKKFKLSSNGGEEYLIPLTAHQKNTEHIQYFYFIHNLMDNLHGLGQSMSQRAGSQRTLIWRLCRWGEKKTTEKNKKTCPNVLLKVHGNATMSQQYIKCLFPHLYCFAQVPQWPSAWEHPVPEHYPAMCTSPPAPAGS